MNVCVYVCSMAACRRALQSRVRSADGCACRFGRAAPCEQTVKPADVRHRGILAQRRRLHLCAATHQPTRGTDTGQRTPYTVR